MQKLFFFLLAICLFSSQANAQKFFTRDAKVKFFSDAKLEKIEASNKSGTAVLDATTGKTEWKVLVKGFIFEKALMQEHFNENYMESSKYPSATFKGEIVNLSDVKFDTDGTYNANVKGKMNMHGVEKEITVPGKITVAAGKVNIKADFNVKCSDYGITIETGKVSNIANDIKVTIDASLSKM